MIDIAAIKEKITCKQFVEHIGLSVNRAGFCCCPLHGEKTASMKLYDDARRGWYCFGCHQGGDVITLASRFYGLGFSETLKQLCSDFGIKCSDAPANPSDRLRMVVTNAVRKSIIEKEKAVRESAEAKYWIAFDEWLNNEKIIEQNQPTDESGEFSAEFVRAIKNRERLSMALDLAEMERGGK